MAGITNKVGKVSIIMAILLKIFTVSPKYHKHIRDPNRARGTLSCDVGNDIYEN